MTLTLVAWFLLNFPLMNPAAKEKSRASAQSRGYLKTRIRGQRLLNVARILALVELTKRLHQTYRFAYDKQAADWLLPQKPVPAPGPDPTEHIGLSPCLQSRLAPYFPGVDLSKVQIRFGFDSLTQFTGGVLNAVGIQVLNGATAITVGNVITFRSRSDYNPDSLNPINGIALIGHEITHVGQEQAGRFGDFQYVREYLNNRAAGMSDYQAYRNISTEREAFKMQGIIQKDLENLKRQLGGNVSWGFPCQPH